MASEYLKWKYRDVKPDAPIQLTDREKRRNWWHYHKWHVILGAILILAVGNLLWHALGVGEVRPDYQVAYVGKDPLPEETVEALEVALAGLGTDENGDGKVTVKVNQYAYTGGQYEGDSEAALYASAANTTLMADLTSCDSYFFLLEDPVAFQENYQILRRLDGALPTSFESGQCALPWTDCPVLSGLELGEYTEVFLDRELTGDSQALLSDLYVARRGFWTDDTVRHPEGCDALWDILIKGASL